MTKRIPKVGDVYKCLDGYRRVVRTGELVRITYVNTGCTTADYTTINSGCKGGWSFANWPNDFEFVSSEQLDFKGKHYINVKAYAEKYGITLAKAHEEIQPKLFEMGYTWSSMAVDGLVHVRYKTSNFLCLNLVEEKELRWCDNEDATESDKEIVIEREETISINFSVKEAPIEYVEFNGSNMKKPSLNKL